MVEIEGLDDLERELARLAAEVSQDTLAHYGKRQMTGKVERRAKQLCPVGESRPGYTGGRLRNSLTTQVSRSLEGVEIRTGSNVEYAPFVEYGTGRRGSASGVEPPADYHYGPKPGMAAHPYLRPAWDEEQENVLSGLADDLGQFIDRVARGPSQWDAAVYQIAHGGD